MYSDIVTPFTNLTKKDCKWRWTKKHDATFAKLKRIVNSEPILSLPDFDKAFEVHTNASDVAIGRVLVQEGHPIPYKSRKLLDRERRYPTHEKEMEAVVHCLKTWNYYLLGRHFTMYTDNVTSYFITQSKLNPKQARWHDDLASFDF